MQLMYSLEFSIIELSERGEGGYNVEEGGRGEGPTALFAGL